MLTSAPSRRLRVRVGGYSFSYALSDMQSSLAQAALGGPHLLSSLARLPQSTSTTAGVTNTASTEAVEVEHVLDGPVDGSTFATLFDPLLRGGSGRAASLALLESARAMDLTAAAAALEAARFVGLRGAAAALQWQLAARFDPYRTSSGVDIEESHTRARRSGVTRGAPQLALANLVVGPPRAETAPLPPPPCALPPSGADLLTAERLPVAYFEVQVFYEPPNAGPGLALLPAWAEGEHGLPEACLWAALCMGEATRGDSPLAAPAAESFISYSAAPGHITVRVCPDAESDAVGGGGGGPGEASTASPALRVGPDLGIGPRASAAGNGSIGSGSGGSSGGGSGGGGGGGSGGGGSGGGNGVLTSNGSQASLLAAARAAQPPLASQTSAAPPVAPGRRLGVFVDSRVGSSVFFLDRLPVRIVDFRGTSLARGARLAVILRSEGSSAVISTDGWFPPASLLVGVPTQQPLAPSQLASAAAAVVTSL